MNSIKCKRESAGWTQARLARELGISRATVAMWETGKSRPRYDMLRRLPDCSAAPSMSCTRTSRKRRRGSRQREVNEMEVRE